MTSTLASIASAALNPLGALKLPMGNQAPSSSRGLKSIAPKIPPYSTTLIVAAVVNNTLAMTNCVYISIQDSDRFIATSDPINYVQLPDGLVYLVKADSSVNPGEMAFNKLQRGVSNLSIGQRIIVSTWFPHPEEINLASLSLQVEFLAKQKLELEEDAAVDLIRTMFPFQVFCKRQEFIVDFHGAPLKFIVTAVDLVPVPSLPEDSAMGAPMQPLSGDRVCGIITQSTEISLDAVTPLNKYFTLKKSQNKARTVFDPNFDFKNFGIGGLGPQFNLILRRAFWSRSLPPIWVRKLGYRHTRGILLYGPPGTGKTLIAKELCKMLKSAPPKVVQGPDILNSYVGKSEQNIRDLFAPAELDQKTNGDNSQLHVIIFDEIDAICKQRGSVRSDSGVHDTIVNQLLTKMDGFDEICNVLVIAMTNRKEMLDEALLRNGRFDVKIEIGLPDEAGRLQILQIHTRKYVSTGVLDPDVDLGVIAKQTKNYAGSDLMTLVGTAATFMNSPVDSDEEQKTVIPNLDLVTNPLELPKMDYDHMKLKMIHFQRALKEVKPLFGISEKALKTCVAGGIINYGAPFQSVLESCNMIIDQTRSRKQSSISTILLQGERGAGKTALAAYVALQSNFPFVKIVSCDDMVSWSEYDKSSQINKIFADACRSPLSLIILDNLERLIDYVPIGPRFSNICLQTLVVLLNKIPDEDEVNKQPRKLLVIGTSSKPQLLQSLELAEAFQLTFDVPQVTGPAEIRTVFESLNVPVQEDDLEAICIGVNIPVSIRKLLMVIEMAAHKVEWVTASRFFECCHKCGINLVETIDVNLRKQISVC